MTMIEKVARAMFDRDVYHGYNHETRESQWRASRRLYRQKARAVVQALREPSLEMEIAGQESWMCEAAAEDRSGANWRAMIDAILSEDDSAKEGDGE